jgi:ubiquinone biosynthesis protein UbiJ
VVTRDSLLRPLESLLNRNIEGSALARRLLGQVAGRKLELRVAATPLRLHFSVADGRLLVRSSADTAPDATIEGTPLALARLAASDAAQSIRAGSVQISGDAEIAQDFQKLFAAAQPDFEEELSRLTGDVVAHHLANAARGALRFGRKARDTFAQNVSEYLSEEGRDVPARIEVEEFLASVDRLREATDRLEARVARLERPGNPR